MDDETSSQPAARFFIALPVPESTHADLSAVLDGYKKIIGYRVPPERWHVTLAWLGEQALPEMLVGALCEPLTQVFVPTVTFTHMGRGRQAGQLWAYVHPTTFLTTLRQRLHERVQAQTIALPPSETFIPHVHVGNFQSGLDRNFVADSPLTLRFQVKAAQLIKSIPVSGEHRYSIEGLLPLTA